MVRNLLSGCGGGVGLILAAVGLVDGIKWPIIALGVALVLASVIGFLWDVIKRRAGGPGGSITATGKYVQQAARVGARATVIQNQNINEPRPRTLAGKDLTACKATLQRYAGTEIDVTQVEPGHEAQAFARELVALLRDAGWMVIGQNTETGGGYAVKGVVVTFATKDLDSRPGLLALVHCLTNFDLEATASTEQGIAADVELRVGAV